MLAVDFHIKQGLPVTTRTAPVKTPQMLGGVLREFRARKGLTQRQLASVLGVDQKYVVEFERGKDTKSLDRLFATLQELGLNLVIEEESAGQHPAAAIPSETTAGIEDAHTPDSHRLRSLVDAHRAELEEAMVEYGAADLRLFGSVARGDAGPNSDVDFIVDLTPIKRMSTLLQAAALNERFREILGVDVDLCAPQLTRDGIPTVALEDAIAI